MFNALTNIKNLEVMVDSVFLYIVISGNKRSLDISSADNVTLISS